MATEKKVTRVTGGSADAQPQPTKQFTPTPESKAKATQLRLFGGLLWILAICAQGGAVVALLKQWEHLMPWVIGFIVIDLLFVIIGSLLWKKSNRLDPASEKNKFKFFIQNQLGLIAAIVAFLPLVIIIFTNKNIDGKQKGILGAIAVVAMLVAGIVGYDFNPPSIEQYTEQTQRVEDLTGGNLVYWTKYGKVYHIYDDCSAINTKKTTEILEGSVAQARELKNITDLCKRCENKAVKAKALEADGEKLLEPVASENDVLEEE